MRVELPVVLELDIDVSEDAVEILGGFRTSGYAARTAVYNREFEVFHECVAAQAELSEESEVRLGLAFNQFVLQHPEIFK